MAAMANQIREYFAKLQNNFQLLPPLAAADLAAVFWFCPKCLSKTANSKHSANKNQNIPLATSSLQARNVILDALTRATRDAGALASENYVKQRYVSDATVVLPVMFQAYASNTTP